MKRLLLILCLCVALSSRAVAQVAYGTLAPATCIAGVGALFYQTSTPPVIYVCAADGTWTSITAYVPTVQSGSALLIFSGTCPDDYTESAALAGKTILGTVAANMDVGTTGGSDAITPTVASLSAAAQTFTGSSANTSGVSGGTPAGTNSALTFTGTASTTVVNHVHTLATGTTATGNFSQVIGTVDTTSGGTGGTPTQTTLGTRSVATVNGAADYTPAGTINTPTFTGSALGTHLHALTATGTNGASAVTGTLNAFDNRSAWIKGIFCVKD